MSKPASVGRITITEAFDARYNRPSSLGPSGGKIGTSACLVEVSFLTNPEEETRLEDEAYQVKIATAIADGINEFLD